MEALRQLCCEQHAHFEHDVKLSDYTTFRIGGKAPALITCPTPQSLEGVLRAVLREKSDFIVLGEGSNVLVSDQGLDTLVVRAFGERPVIERSKNVLTAYAGTRMDDVVKFAMGSSLEGLGFASGIPGTFGGAIVGNAGAFGKQISDCLLEVEVMDRQGCKKRIPGHDLNFSYRESALKHSQDIVISAAVQLKDGDLSKLRSEREEILALRHSKHPDYRKLPCAGSFFKNIVYPDGTRKASGWFLDQVGCKEISVGGAAVFEGHANIIINRGQATARDVYELSQVMKQKVFEKFQIRLEPEVRMLGVFN